MYFVSLSIKSDCGLSKAATSLDQRIITLNVINKSNLNNIIAFTMSQDTSSIKENFIKDFSNFSIIRGKRSIFIYGVKESHGIVPSILESSSIPLYPFVAENGIESFQILTPNRDSFERLVALIEKANEIENINYERILDGDSMNSIFKKIGKEMYLSSLTETEMKIMNKAVNNGFYSWPRMFDLSSISSSFNLTKPTVLYHLRNAEKKILESLFGQ